jgi:Rrf2 family protein
MEESVRLTSFTDHALRLLLMVHEADGRLVTIEQAALRFRLSRANLMKIANQLTSSGFLVGIRGRSGGLKLAIHASEIRIGDVVRAMEADFSLVECLGETNDCAIAEICRLPRVFRRARQAFLDELDATTLADVGLHPAARTPPNGARPAVESAQMSMAARSRDLTGVQIDVTKDDMNALESRPYDSPLRRAQTDATRDRILQALADVLHTTGGDEIMFDEIAKAAGVERRTVFRHFPNKTELLKAFWLWIGARIGPQILPSTLDDLVAMPPEIFAGFDANENVIRASLHSPSGRAMRQEVMPARRQSFARIVEDGLQDLSATQRRDFQALAHLLVSATAWETLKDYAGLSGKDAGKTVSRALTLLMTALRSESRGATQTAKGKD